MPSTRRSEPFDPVLSVTLAPRILARTLDAAADADLPLGMLVERVLAAWLEANGRGPLVAPRRTHAMLPPAVRDDGRIR